MKSVEMPNGHLRIYMRIGKANTPLKYLNVDGSVRHEIITPEALFSKQTMDSFKMVPVTYGHPSHPLNDQNTTQFLKGMTGNSVFIEDNSFLGSVATIVDKDLKEAIRSRKADQVSPGYITKLDGGSGSSSDPYKQAYRLANHVANVEKGRHGPTVAVQLDSTDSEIWVQEYEPELYRKDFDEAFIDNVLVNLDTSGGDPGFIKKSVIDLSNFVKPNGTSMVSITIGKKTFNVDGDDARALRDVVAETLTRLDSLESENAKNQGTIDTLTEERDDARNDSARHEAQLEVVQEELKTEKAKPAFNKDEYETRMDAEMTSRIERWALVLPHLRNDNAEFKPDYSLSTTDIERLWVVSQKPQYKEDSRMKLDGFVSGLWEALKPTEAPKSNADSSDTAREDEQQTIFSDGLLAQINAARADAASNDEAVTEDPEERSDMTGASHYNMSGKKGKEKENLIAKRRRERSKQPVGGAK